MILLSKLNSVLNISFKSVDNSCIKTRTTLLFLLIPQQSKSLPTFPSFITIPHYLPSSVCSVCIKSRLTSLSFCVLVTCSLKRREKWDDNEWHERTSLFFPYFSLNTQHSIERRTSQTNLAANMLSVNRDIISYHKQCIS